MREQNPRLYWFHEHCAAAYFWAPVSFLYLLSLFPLADVVALEACMQLSTFALEVPSGYLSDRLGRRRTLLAAATCGATALAMFVLGGGFAWFVAAEVLLAADFALRSGTDVSFHLASLRELGREEEFPAREARFATTKLTASATACLLGGLAGAWDFRAAYALAATAALVRLAVTWRMVEPEEDAEMPLAVGLGDLVGQLRACLGQLRRPVLAWCVGVMVMRAILDHLPYQFYQPYLALLGGPEAGAGTPLAAAAHVTTSMALGALLARLAPGLHARFGFRFVVLGALLFELCMPVAMALVLHPAVLGLVLLREAPNALIRAQWRAVVVPRVPARMRATFLSINALACRLSVAATLWVLRALGGGDGAARGHADLASMLWVGVALGGAGWLLLAVTAGAGREAAPAETSEAPP